MNKLNLIIITLSAQFTIAGSAQAQTYVTTTQFVEPAPYCREYTQTLKIANTVQKAYGTACRQPDGSWQLMPATQQIGAQPPAQITYIVRDERLYYVPPPFIDVQIRGGHGHRGRYHH